MNSHRGLLVIHGTGTGKTLSAVTISQCYLDVNPTHTITFIGPSSLEDNFKKELQKYGVKNNSKYKFYSFERFLSNTKRRKYNSVINANDRNKIGWPLNPINLKNSLLIVDEAHNSRNSNTATSRAVQQSSFTADKVVLLTATPFVNRLQDFIPMINMIQGRYVIGTKKEYDNSLVSDYFTSKKIPTKHDINTFKKLLKDRVDVVTKKDQKFFPKRKDHMIYVKMSPAYLKAYTNLVSGQRFGNFFFKYPYKFYNGYRRAVNIAGPTYFSSKVKKALPYIKQGKTLIYSNWLNFGVKPISDSLIKEDITFQSFTGKTPKNKRQEIVNEFNNNKYQVLIISSAGGEGLDLKGVRNVIVLDPTWNDAGLEQVIGRAIRYKSHSHLPPKERIVNIYLMALVDPKVDISKIRENVVSRKITNNEIIDSGDLLLYDIIKRKVKVEKMLNKELEKISITN